MPLAARMRFLTAALMCVIMYIMGIFPHKNWVYGHGTFSLTSLEMPILGIFQWMPNSGNEAKKMEKEIINYSGTVKKVFMDSKADDQKIYFNLKNNYRI